MSDAILNRVALTFDAEIKRVTTQVAYAKAYNRIDALGDTATLKDAKLTLLQMMEECK